MNYRHAFHAGNHADVFKHLTLTRLIALMSRKEQPFAYLDTHAGIGLYDLHGDQANRTGEYLEGIARLWGKSDLPPLTADYMRVLHEMNPDGQLRYYPAEIQMVCREPLIARDLPRVVWLRPLPGGYWLYWFSSGLGARTGSVRRHPHRLTPLPFEGPACVAPVAHRGGLTLQHAKHPTGCWPLLARRFPARSS
jgi:hypothetical protein